MYKNEYFWSPVHIPEMDFHSVGMGKSPCLRSFSVILMHMQDPALVKGPGLHVQIGYNLLHNLG